MSRFENLKMRAIIFNLACIILMLSPLFWRGAGGEAFSQNVDTLYYNQDWEGSTKENASFYRLIKKENNLYWVEDHYINNVLQMSGSFSSLNPELYEGYFKYYSEKGVLNKEGMFTKNVEEGEWKLYYDDGKPMRVENYVNGNLEGNLKSYYPNGQLRRDEDYNHGKMLKGKCYTPEGKDTAFFSSYKMPEYTGGLAALKKYMKDNNKYPKDAFDKGIEGTVFVKFTVTATGDIENAEVQKPVFPSLDEEALRLVTHMPKWQPGKKNDMPQRVLFNIPIYFKLSEAKTETKEK